MSLSGAGVSYRLIGSVWKLCDPNWGEEWSLVKPHMKLDESDPGRMTRDSLPGRMPHRWSTRVARAGDGVPGRLEQRRKETDAGWSARGTLPGRLELDVSRPN